MSSDEVPLMENITTCQRHSFEDMSAKVLPTKRQEIDDNIARYCIGTINHWTKVLFWEREVVGNKRCKFQNQN